MLLNRLLDAVRSVTLDSTLLRRRARAQSDRPPLVFVPGMFGTRLVDEDGRTLWGSTARIFHGPPIAAAKNARPDGVLEALAVVPGLAGVDVHGGLLRFLERVGGYRRGEDLFVLDYDWRAGAVAAAACLEALVAALRGAGQERVDLVSVSTGAQIVRYFLAYGGVDVLGTGAAGEGRSSWVRRVVYVGGPQRGTFDALACLSRGFQFAPGGRRLDAHEAALCQTSWDALPHPDEPVFVDDEGMPLALDLYDAATWTHWNLSPADPSLVAASLRRAKALHAALDAAPAWHDVTVIGARNLPTPARVVIENGRACLPTPKPRPDDPLVSLRYRPGDGELPASSLAALPGLEKENLWWVTPGAHHKLPSDGKVHRFVVEALLATERHIPETNLLRSSDWPRRPKK